MTIEIRRSTRPVKAGNQSAKNSSGWLDINSKEMEKSQYLQDAKAHTWITVCQ
jgi:hypothetical protein